MIVHTIWQAVVIILLAFALAVYAVVKLTYAALDWLAGKVEKALKE